MKIKTIAKLLFFFLLVETAFSKSFFITEPIFNSKVNVRLEGNTNNPPLVLIHGLGKEASSIWDETIQKYKNNYYIITFDLPGFGKSSKGNYKLTPYNYALVSDYIVSKYTEKKAILIGHSMGGAIALKYTSMYPKKIGSLALLDVAGILNKDAYGEFLVKTGINKRVNNSKISSFLLDTMIGITNTINKIVPKDIEYLYDNSRLRKLTFKSNSTTLAALGLVFEDFSTVLHNIDTPTYIIWGENDDIAPIRTAYVLNKLLKNSSLNIIKGAKHVPMLHNKEEYFSYLNNFFLKKAKIVEYKQREMIETKVISSQKNSVIEGSFENLIIKDSKNITIKNSYIKNLKINNSNVEIINSNISSNTTALNIRESKVLLTASNITADNAIIFKDSSLDIAGCKIIGFKNAIKNIGNSNSSIIFSITSLNGKTVHEKISLARDKRL